MGNNNIRNSKTTEMHQLQTKDEIYDEYIDYN